MPDITVLNTAFKIFRIKELISPKLKTILVVLFLTFSIPVFANVYYVSADGNDRNPGTSESAAWQTLAKVNRTIFHPGDVILFQRGDVFHGSLKINYSGAPDAPIMYGAYGKGANPVISGFVHATNWKLHGDNIYRAYLYSGKKLNMVNVNGNNTPVGRYPNRGYLTINSFNNSASWIISNQLSGGLNWKGAEVVIRKNRWTLTRDPIISQLNNKIIFNNTSRKNIISNEFGFFIQNDLKTLDKPGEWFYDGTYLYIYYNSLPSDTLVKAGIVDTLVAINDKKNITFSELTFTGANSDAFNSTNSYNINILNCNILYSGNNAISAEGGSQLKIEHCVIQHSYNHAIYSWVDNTEIRSNEIKYTGLVPGAVRWSFGMTAISSNGDNTFIEYNKIENSGYNGIHLRGGNTTIKNNFINNFCMVVDDGGGIYTSSTRYPNRVIIGNIIINGISAPEGTNRTYCMADGIYLDEPISDVLTVGNTVAYCSAGIKLHRAFNNKIEKNTTYGNEKQLQFLNLKGEEALSGNVIDNNIFVPANEKQLAIYFSSVIKDIDFGTSSSNHYTIYKETDKNFFINYPGYTNNYLTFQEWKNRTGKDLNSQLSPAPEDPNAVIFEYNAEKNPKSIPISYPMVDATGEKHQHNVIIPPYSSVILFPDTDTIGNKGSAIEFEEDISICKGEKYCGWGEPGKYVRTMKSINGNDSVITTNLWVNDTFLVTENITITKGENYLDWTEPGRYERVFSSSSGCDSTVITNLTIKVPDAVEVEEYVAICQGQEYIDWNTTGEYKRTFSAVSGADSIVTTKLEVKPVYKIAEDITIPPDSSYNGWTNPGEYTRTLTSVNGCDSIVTTQLFFSPYYSAEEINICEGGSYEGWTETGEYKKSLKTESGKDSIVTTFLWVNPVYTIIEDTTILENENYFGWNETGQYQRVLTSVEGCDSIVVVNLTVEKIPEKIPNEPLADPNNPYFEWSASKKYQREYNPVISYDFKMYPNPAKNFVFIDYTYKPNMETKIELLNDRGKTLFTMSANSALNKIPVYRYPSGMYFVRSLNSQNEFVKKLIIE